MWTRGRLVSKVREGKEEDGAKFSDYFDFAEPFTKLPSHRILAMFRGEKEEMLDLTLEPDEPAEPAARAATEYERRSPTASASPTRDARPTGGCSTRCAGPGGPGSSMHLGIDLRMRLWQAAEDEAVRVFAANLRDLLLAAPAGTRPTMGLDPGFRTGVKVAVVDATGKVRRDRHDLPARAAPPLGRVARDAGRARPRRTRWS